MLLRDELDVYGCDAEENVFDEAIAEEFSRENRDRSADELICDWPAARCLCRRISARFRLGEDGIADEMILRRLLTIRKNHRDMLPPVSRKGFGKLEASLKTEGIQVDPDRFRMTIRSAYLDLHKKRPIERTLCTWRDAAHLCGVVARMLQIERSIASDALVLATLLNMRRQGQLNHRDREEAPR